MPVTPSYQAFVLDQLSRVADSIRARRMFGGVGIYAGDCFFALIDDDTVFLKVNDSNRNDFIAAGMGPFRPFGEGGETMQYYELPADLLEDGEALARWVGKAIEVARRAKKPGPRRRGKGPA
jgi:TfoX/Sxy family transcriptional regulator of competence genes